MKLVDRKQYVMNDGVYRSIEVTPISGALGALVTGVELKKPLQEGVFAEIYKAFLDYKVIFFKDQDLNPETQLQFGRMLDNLLSIPLLRAYRIFLK